MASNAKRPEQVVAEQVKAWRQERGTSARELAERVESRGGKLDRVAIASIEAGKRGVSLDEALQLAAALGIAPLHLFIPREDDATVLAAPDLPVSAVKARRWVRGQEPLPGMSEKVFRTEVPESEWQAARQPSERELEAFAAWERASRQLRIAETLHEMRRQEYAKVQHLEHIGGLPDYRRADRKLDEALAGVAEARVEVDEARDRYREVARAVATKED